MGSKAKALRIRPLKLQFLNRNKEKFDWDNDDLGNIKGLVVEDDQQAHPELTAGMSGIKLESEQVEPGPAVEAVEVSDTEIGARATANANM